MGFITAKHGKACIRIDIGAVRIALCVHPGIAILAMLATGAFGIGNAYARGHRPHHAVHGRDYRPPYADFVIDDNSGAVLHETNPDELRHPASLTKIMTLYLLFEQIESGNFQLNSPLPVSMHAALQPPTKLHLKPGQPLQVTDAIEAIVTRSANDAAVVVAEAIAGTEDEFSKMMTQKAQTLGMMNTIYVNATGLPAEDQITTARDQAHLGLAIQNRFPAYSRYFATQDFTYRGVKIRNHNMLLGAVDGVDGIKTGYTDASGYNLVASVHRDNRHIIGVVLGGTSNGARDARMRELIEQCIVHAATQRTAPMVVEATPPSPPKPTLFNMGVSVVPSLTSPAKADELTSSPVQQIAPSAAQSDGQYELPKKFEQVP